MVPNSISAPLTRLKYVSASSWRSPLDDVIWESFQFMWLLILQVVCLGQRTPPASSELKKQITSPVLYTYPTPQLEPQEAETNGKTAVRL